MPIQERGSNMIEKKTMEEFRETGLLWLINTTLHIFGWCIVVEFDDDDNAVSMYPARCKFRGFDEKSNDKGYENITRYMKDNAHNLGDDLDL